MAKHSLPTTAKIMKAFKGTDLDMCCRGFKYEIGKTYEHAGPLQPCVSGFHACQRLFDVQQYYEPCNSRYFEVELAGEMQITDDKVCANRITIIRELPFWEVLAGLNLNEEEMPFSKGENRNLGFKNIGNHNNGNYNIGNHNTGNYNTGNTNIGNYNIGNYNTGNYNTGNDNNGNTNTGNYNTGNTNRGNDNNGNDINA